MQKFLIIKSADSGSRTKYFNKFSVDLKIDRFHDYIKSVQICSAISGKAHGAGGRNTKTSTYCNEELFL
jgi:hypothetical protein